MSSMLSQPTVGSPSPRTLGSRMRLSILTRLFSATENPSSATISGSRLTRPWLILPGPQTVTAGSKLTFIVSATDPDGPLDYITILCENCDQLGATFDSSTGNFTWVPAIAQGPRDYSATFSATDHLLPFLSDTKSVAVHVNTLNQPPSLAPIKDWIINDETLLTFKANATDPDIPMETLTFSLDSDAPAGASISPDDVFPWTPTDAQSAA